VGKTAKSAQRRQGREAGFPLEGGSTAAALQGEFVAPTESCREAGFPLEGGSTAAALQDEFVARRDKFSDKFKVFYYHYERSIGFLPVCRRPRTPCS
jgi:hypothetical protein